MKKILFSLFLFISTNSFAVGLLQKSGQIPGFLEVEASIAQYQPSWCDGQNNSRLWFKYGYGSDVFQPYFFGAWDTYAENHTTTQHYPFRDIYSYGFGADIFEIFFVQFEHRCSHWVDCRANSEQNLETDPYLYNGMLGSYVNIYKFGIKFKFD